MLKKYRFKQCGLVFLTSFAFNFPALSDDVIKEIKLKAIPDKQAEIENGEIVVRNGMFEHDLILRTNGTAKLQSMECKITKGNIIVCLHGGVLATVMAVDLEKMRFLSSSVMSADAYNSGDLTMGILRYAK